MDFNTGRGSGGPPDRGDGSSGSMFGGENPSNDQPDRPGDDTGSDFTLSDPTGSFVRTTVGVLTRPTGFFRGIARRGDFVSPAAYAIICTLIATIIGGLVGLALSALLSTMAEYEGALAYGVFGFLTDVVVTPFATIITLFILSGIYHVLVILLARPSNAGFEATFRVVCYVSAIAIIGWIPFVNLIAGIYGLYVAYFGIREVHATTNQRAAAIVALPSLAIIFLIILITGADIFIQAT